MYTLKKWALALSLPLVALGASAAQSANKVNGLPDIAKMKYQAQNYKTLFKSDRNVKIDQLNKRLAAGKKDISTPDFSLPLSDQYEYLDGPNGSIYFCSGEYETVDTKYEYYVDKSIVGFKFTLFDCDFNKVGEIKGKVNLDTTSDPENPEIRVASLGIAPIVTRKFFNYDDKLEVMVYLNMNTPNYTIKSRSVAYQIGGEKDAEGYDIPLCTINGNLCDVLEANSSKWSEDFYLTFVTDYYFPVDDNESFSAFANSQGMLIETYKKVTYGSKEPEKIFEYKMRLNEWPGDQENASPLISRCIDGKPYFAINGYTDGLWVFTEGDNEFGFSDQIWNENTKFFVDIYQPTSLANPNRLQHTEIDMVKSPGENIYATFYFLGALGYRDDINYEYCDQEGKANFIITTKDWDGAEMGTTSSYYLYSPDGKLDATIAENIEGVVQMSDIEGQEPQYMFVTNLNGEYTFDFINPFNAVNSHSFPQVLEWNGDYEGLYVNVDRVAYGDSYQYCFELSTPGLDDDGNDIMRIAWVSPEGEITKVDEINMGQNVRMAKVYIGQEVLSPYYFNTNAEREYMIIVKRAVDQYSSSTEEEFLIGTAASPFKPEGEIILDLKPDETMGTLLQVATISGDNNPLLWVMYYNNTTDKYSQILYNLPLVKFAGGDGSAENPYQIATLGDLQCIRNNINAHYEVIADIDASGEEFVTLGSSSLPFTGSIKGNGHAISNLTIGGNGSTKAMFNYITNGSISDLTFVNPTIKIDGGTYKAALIGGDIQKTTISNVHAIGLTAESTDDIEFGGLAGKLTLTSSVIGCSVSNASINLPGASSVGGIVAETRTGASISATTFSGSLKAKSAVGGILGTSGPNSGNISDCHVDADITAENIVGGIVGEMDTRILVDRCYVEGNLSASKTFSTGINKKGYALGGVVGSISNYYEPAETSEENKKSNEVVTNCYVNLESLSAPALPDGHQNSVHRIAGFTSINNLEPDWDNIDDASKIDKFLPTVAEPGLKNNYVTSAIAKVDDGVEADHTTTEGKDIESAEVDNSFLESLGYKFGETAEMPWKESAGSDPALYYETGARFVVDEMNVEVNKPFNADLVIISRKAMTADEFADGFACEISDEQVVEMTGELSMSNNVATIGFNALKEGSAEFTANVNGSLAKVKFNVLSSLSAIEEIESNDSKVSIKFADSTVTAEGALIEVFALDGKKVAVGRNALSLAALPNGFYIVKATDASGNQATAKLLLR